MNLMTKDFTDAIEARLSGSDLKVTEIDCRMTEMEQKNARRGYHSDGNYEPQTLGAQFVAADGLKDFADFRSRPSRFSLEMKSTITSATGSGNDLIVPGRDTLLTLPQRELRVRDLLTTVPVTTGSVEYPRMVTSTNAAASVAEGALKPESAMTFDLVTVPIRTIAHWIPASRQVLDDAPQLQGIIDSELMYGLKFVEANQLLNGSGSGTDLGGIYTQATAFAAGTAVVPTRNKIDVILHAILQCAVAMLPADG